MSNFYTYLVKILKRWYLFTCSFSFIPEMNNHHCLNIMLGTHKKWISFTHSQSSLGISCYPASVLNLSSIHVRGRGLAIWTFRQCPVAWWFRWVGGLAGCVKIGWSLVNIFTAHSMNNRPTWVKDAPFGRIGQSKPFCVCVKLGMLH